MKVGLANWTSRHAGGVETYVGLAAAALAAAGHEIFFIHEQAAPSDRPPIDGLDSFPSCCVAASGIDAAIGMVRRWKPEIMFVQRLSDPGVESALLSLAPSVFFAHDYQGLCISGYRLHQARADQACHERFDVRCLARFFPYRCGGRNPVTMWTAFRQQTAILDRLRAYDDVACFSEHMRALFLRQGFAAERVHCVTPLAAPAVPRAPRPIGADGVRLLFMGRLERIKGCHLLIDALPAVAARLNTDVTLVIAGQGAEDAHCRDRAARAALECPRVKVLFLGWQTKAQGQALLADSDVAVLPSLWPEPLGLAGLEALHAGVPVAAFNVGAIPEWLRDGHTGAIAPAAPPTAAGLARAIERCLTSSAIRAGASAHRGDGESIAAHAAGLSSIFRRAVARAS
jgi:glycosyltransferase involved in cell wall biosynthesis